MKASRRFSLGLPPWSVVLLVILAAGVGASSAHLGHAQGSRQTLEAPSDRRAAGDRLVTGSKGGVATPESAARPAIPRLRLATELLNRSDALRLAWSPDGKRLAVGGPLDQTVTIWSVQERSILLTLRGEEGGIDALAYSPDGHYLVVGRGFLRWTTDRLLNVYDTRTGTLIRNVPSPGVRGSSNVTSLVFAQSGYLGVGHRDLISLYTGPADNLVRRILTETIAAPIVFGARGAQLAYGSLRITDGYALRVLDLEGQVISTLRRHQRGVEGSPSVLTFSPDGTRLLCGCGDRVGIYDLSSGGLEELPDRHEPPINMLAYAPDGRHLVSGAGRTIRVWDVKRQQVIQTERKGVLEGAAWTPDGQWFATSEGRRITIWQLAIQNNTQ